MSRVLLTLLAICLVASGDSRDGPGGGGDAATPPIGLSCAEPTCQGDLTGTWDITGACIDEYDVVEERSTCAGWECTVVAASASGHLTFAATTGASRATSSASAGWSTPTALPRSRRLR